MNICRKFPYFHSIYVSNNYWLYGWELRSKDENKIVFEEVNCISISLKNYTNYKNIISLIIERRYGK